MSEYTVLIVSILICTMCTSIFLIGVGVRLMMYIWVNLELEKRKRCARRESEKIATEFDIGTNEDLEEVQLVEDSLSSDESPVTATV